MDMDYRLQVSRLGYQINIVEFEITENGKTEEVNFSLAAVNVDAGYGKQISGPTSQGTNEDIVMENNKLAMTIADISTDDSFQV